MLSSNALHGPLPDAEHTIVFGNTLQHLHLSDNRIEGPLTTGFLSHFTHLEILSLSHNRLTGPLPDPYRTINTLMAVDVSEGNNLIDTSLMD